MELVYDWKGFHSVFNPRKKTNPNAASQALTPVFMVLDGKTILTAFCENEDLSDWVGAPFDEIIKNCAHRETVVFERKKVEEWLSESLQLPHFHDEIQFLRDKAKNELMGLKKFNQQPFFIPGHFLLEAVQGWWNKLIPSTYGIYIRLNDEKGPSLLIVVQRKKLISFQVPDLWSMPADKRKNLPEIVKYLSERYLIPVQGFSFTMDEWLEWSDTPNPWPKILAALRSDREKAAPFSVGLISLIASRAYFGL